jgi:hypothetical protein
MKDETRVALWDAINQYVIACGGDTSDKTVSSPRMDAVVAIKNVLRQIEGDAESQGRASFITRALARWKETHPNPEPARFVQEMPPGASVLYFKVDDDDRE